MIDISILTYDKSCKMNKKHDGNDFHICISSLALIFICYLEERHVFTILSDQVNLFVSENSVDKPYKDSLNKYIIIS